MPDVTDRERFDFEREKWRADFDMRAREVAVKEREQASSKWRNPLVIGVFAAALAALGNAGVAFINGSLQRDLDSRKRDAELRLEESKAESARILEMIKTGDPERAAANMQFLLKSGLLTNEERAERLASYLKDRPSGTGPALPPASQFRFESTDALTPSIQSELNKHLDAFVSYVSKIGFPADASKPTIKIDKLNDAGAYYEPANMRVVVDARLVGDPTAYLREFANHVLMRRSGLPKWEPRRMFARIETGMADYLVASQLDAPGIWDRAAKVTNQRYARALDKDRKFGELDRAANDFDSLKSGSEIWGGVLWKAREALGREGFDPVVAQAWLETKWPPDDGEMPLAFTTALLEAAKQKLPARADAVRTILQGRGFPLPR